MNFTMPIVTSYSENIKNNVEEIGRGEVIFRNPFMSFKSLQTVTEALTREFCELPITAVMDAAEAAWSELAAARQDMRDKGEEVLRWKPTISVALCWRDVPTTLIRKSTTVFPS